MQTLIVNLRREKDIPVYYYLQDQYINFSLSNLQNSTLYSFKIYLMEVLNNDTLQPYIPQVNYKYSYSIFSVQNPTELLLDDETFTMTSDEEG